MQINSCSTRTSLLRFRRTTRVARPRLTQSQATRALHKDDLPPEAAVPETEVTFLTSDGLVCLPVGRRRRPQGSSSTSALRPMPTWQEQGLCIGASFRVAATNGINPARRVHISGFTGSIDYLYASVEDTVLSRGGRILEEDRQLRSGVHETLILIVAIPYLWGVPPQLEALSSAIKLGGGLVEHVQREWVLYGQDTDPDAGWPSRGGSAGDQEHRWH